MTTWKFRDFTHRKGDIGRFEIWSYSATDTYDVCKIVSYCQSDAIAKWVAKTLYEMAMNAIPEKYDFKFNITSKKYKVSGPKYNTIEVSALVSMTPAAVIASIAKYAGAPPVEELVVKPDALSVGPCAWEDKYGIYAKVRFNGYSVPFYYDNEKFIESTTKHAISEQIGAAYAGPVMKVLQENVKMLHERAVTRPLNLSGIEDYAKHNITILKGDGNGRYYSATNTEIADPNAEIATVFSYGWNHTFAVIDDKVYKVKGVIAGHQLSNLKNPIKDEDKAFSESWYNLDYEWGSGKAKGYMRMKDCIPLDPRDQYVREKIGRSMKAKL